MPYPSNSDYLQNVKIDENFNVLRPIEPVMEGNEVYYISGGNAIVFKMVSKGKTIALKCFQREEASRIERYIAITDYIKNNPSAYFAEYQFLENELFIKGSEYPVVAF